MKRHLAFGMKMFNLAPDDFRYILNLLEPRARFKYLVLSSFQVLLAFIEVLTLSVLALTISLSLNSYTNVSKKQEGSLGLLQSILLDQSTEDRIGVLLITYVFLTIFKTSLSAILTLSTFKLLAKQAAIIGFRINKDSFYQGISVIRFGKSQENLSGIMGSLESLLLGYLGSFSQLSGDFATIVMVGVALLLLDLESSILLFILFASLLFALNRFVNIGASRMSRVVAISSAQLSRRVLDSWLIYREILLAQKVDDRLASTLPTRLERADNIARLNFLPSLSKYIFEIFLVVSALVVSAIQLWMNGISDAIGSFSLIIGASARLLPALLRLQGSLLALRQSEGGGVFARSMLETLNQEIDGLAHPTSGDFSKGQFCAKVLVENLSFSYPDADKHAIKDISLSITPGTFTAIVGSSGSGKSTLVDLILGFLQPSSGIVRISNLEPSVAYRIWPGSIAYVPQDVQVIEGTIAENISLVSNNRFDEMSLRKSIELSGLFDDVQNLAEGIRTEVGERGLKLSGGQKQRLGIARALYSKPSLIIFDEATSSLDPITEDKITKNIYRKLPDVTVIVIAHRLSTVKSADKIIYLKDGRLVASGTFDELKDSVPEFLTQAELSGL